MFAPVPGLWGHLVWMAVWMTLFQSFVAAVVMQGAPAALRVWYLVAFVTATTFYNWYQATRGENWKVFSVVMTAVAISGGLLRLALRRRGSKSQAA